MASVIQRVSNWLSGEYPVGATEIGSGTSRKLIQHVRLTDDSGTYVSPGSPTQPGTATRTQVADNSSDVLILAANTSRLAAQIFNDSSALLYVGLGTTATTATNYTAKVFSNGYYEVPAGFTGQIRGIWATDPNDGAARVTELTA